MLARTNLVYYGDMGKTMPFEKRCLVMGVLSVLPDDTAVMEELEKAFGPVSRRTESVPFSFTGYYDGEMGSRPERFFLVFQNLVDPADLAGIKAVTNRIEDSFSVEGNRQINLDPGILSLGSFILATTKDSPHRIPLNNGIYAETTLLYHHHSFHPLEWTYADYSSPRFVELFNELRLDFKHRK